MVLLSAPSLRCKNDCAHHIFVGPATEFREPQVDEGSGMRKLDGASSKSPRVISMPFAAISTQLGELLMSYLCYDSIAICYMGTTYLRVEISVSTASNTCRFSHCIREARSTS